MEGTEERSILAIQVTETQRETIRHLFNHNDWDFQEVPIEESTDQSNLSNNDQELRNSSFIKIRKQRSASIVWVALVLPLRQTDKCGGLRNQKRQTEVIPIEERININDSGQCFFIEMFGQIQDIRSEKEDFCSMTPVDETMHTIGEILCLNV